MDNEMNGDTMPSYWNSVFIGALIVAIVMAVLGIVSQYMIIGSEPVGSSFTLGQGVGTIACLFGAIGGFLATRHYAKENEVTFPIGKGAVIGLLVGIFGVLISTVISLTWNYIIDPDLAQAVYDWSILNLEAQNLTDDQMDMAKGFIPEPGSTSTLIWQVGLGLLVLGILNAISGLIGAKVFASEED